MKKCPHVPYHYITLHYLMCSKCKKKIRKLNISDVGTMLYAGIIPLPTNLLKKYGKRNLYLRRSKSWE